MEDSGASSSVSDLLCREDGASLNEEFDKDPYDLNFSGDDEDKYIESLIQKEKSSGSEGNTSSDGSSTMNKRWVKCARLDATKWILRTRAFFGFQFRTAYLSLIYFDLFLSRRSIDDGKHWAIRLLSIACLSLAAKMEECKVPTLSEYPRGEYNFASKVIQRMELLVLNALEWRMALITPFVYLHYFITKFLDEPKPRELVPKAVELIMTAIKEVNLMDHRASIIAAAAVLAAFNTQLTKETVELKISLISSWGSIENGLEMAKFKTPKAISPNLLSPTSSFGDVLENSAITSAVGTKRRLEFNDHDYGCLEKVHRR